MKICDKCIFMLANYKCAKCNNTKQKTTKCYEFYENLKEVNTKLLIKRLKIYKI